jgi:hypothetical protein
VHVTARCHATATPVANGLANCKPCWIIIPYFCAKWRACTLLTPYASLWMPHHAVMFKHGSWLVCGHIIGMFVCTRMVPGLQVRKSQRRSAALRCLHVEDAEYIYVTQYTNYICLTSASRHLRAFQCLPRMGHWTQDYVRRSLHARTEIILPASMSWVQHQVSNLNWGK